MEDPTFIEHLVKSGYLAVTLVRCVDACSYISQGCVNLHESGLSDFDGDAYKEQLQAGIHNLEQLKKHVNAELANLLTSLCSYMQEIYDVDSHITVVYARVFQKDITNMVEIKAFLLVSRVRGEPLPPEVISLISVSKSLGAQIRDVQQKIHIQIKDL